jgi:pyridoxal biosynthesis lyase PdxS
MKYLSNKSSTQQTNSKQKMSAPNTVKIIQRRITLPVMAKFMKKTTH